MAWVDIQTWTFTPQKDLTAHLQYDNTSKTFTSVNVRVTLTYPSGWSSTSYNSDAYFLLWGDPASNKVYNIKAPGVNWGNATPASIPVTKTHSTANFTIPSFWVCCSGHMLPDSSGYLQYGDGKGGKIRDTAYNWFKSGGRGRSNYKLTCTSQTLAGDYWVALDKPAKPSVTNNHNNTFSASCSSATSKHNNTVEYTTLQYATSSSGPWTNASNKKGTKSIVNQKHTASVGTATQAIYVRTWVDSTREDAKYSDNATVTLKNYVAPDLPTVGPTITKTKNRFTIKEPWVISWKNSNQKSSQKNSSSAVAGYRLVLQVKKGGTGSFTSVAIKNSSGTVISKTPDGTTWNTIDTVDLSDTEQITIYPELQEFEAGDIVRVGIRPYILWGADKPSHTNSASNSYKLFAASASNDAYRFSNEITIQNAGVVRLQVGNSAPNFKEGRVWVKMPDASNPSLSKWYEADIVKVKTSGGWKESE